MIAAALPPLFTGRFEARLFEWRGPAPFLFAAVPDAMVGEIKFAARHVSYGWGMVPATLDMAGVRFQTSLFPREGGYLVPIKVAVQTVSGARPGSSYVFEIIIAAA